MPGEQQRANDVGDFASPQGYPTTCFSEPIGESAGGDVSDDLRDNASVQYGDLKGTLAGDEVDFSGLTPVLGIDGSKWQLLVVEFSFYGGTQHLRAWGVPADLGGWEGLKTMIAEKGQVEVTLLIDRTQSLEGHADTNPPAPQAESMFGLVGDFLVYGFKRLNGRMVSRNIPDPSCPIVEVDSIAEYEEL